MLLKNTLHFLLNLVIFCFCVWRETHLFAIFEEIFFFMNLSYFMRVESICKYVKTLTIYRSAGFLYIFLTRVLECLMKEVIEFKLSMTVLITRCWYKNSKVTEFKLSMTFLDMGTWYFGSKVTEFKLSMISLDMGAWMIMLKQLN